MKTSHKSTFPAFLAGLLLAALAGSSAFGTTTIIYDDYNATANGTGFALQKGINAGITNTSGTRLTGTLITVNNRNLRYINTGKKPGSVYLINSAGTRARVESDGSFGQFTLSTGSAAFDFASAIGSDDATPGNPVVYDVTISMANGDDSTAKMAFGIATTAPAADPNTVGNDTWDFGIQIYRAAAADANNTVGKLIDSGSSGAADVKAPIETTTVGMGSMIAFLIRVTDAGAESGANYHSRVQVSRDAGSTWIYDTATDGDLPNGWRFDGATRYFSWDQAQTVDLCTYDNFLVKVYTSTWNGGGTGDNWNTAANWSSGSAPDTTAGEELTFAGSTRLTPNMSVDYNLYGLQFASGAGSFTIGATAGTTLTLNGDIQQNAANAQTLNTPISIAATRTLNAASGNLTIGGAISGAGGIIKSGAETLTLGAANSYNGNTTVSAGTLLVNGSLGSGAVTVQDTAALGGNGAIGGDITVQNGGTLSPSDSSIGTLTANGNLALNSGSKTSVEVNRSGLSSDSVTVIGTFTIGGTLEVANTGAALEAGDVFTLFSATSKSGEFAAISPANPNSDQDLAWDTPYLKETGILRVHRSPSANNLNISRGSGTSLKIKLSDLFSSPDGDGDPVLLEQCKPSTRGGTITTSATHIFYDLASNDNDDFDYVVTDNRGGKRTRKITISVADAFGPTQQITLVDGKPAVSFAGIPGTRYDVQRATDVNFTQNVTTVLSTNAPSGGLFLLVEEPSLPEAYYRLKYPGTPAP